MYVLSSTRKKTITNFQKFRLGNEAQLYNSMRCFPYMHWTPFIIPRLRISNTCLSFRCEIPNSFWSFDKLAFGCHVRRVQYSRGSHSHRIISAITKVSKRNKTGTTLGGQPQRSDCIPLNTKSWNWLCLPRTIIFFQGKNCAQYLTYEEHPILDDHDNADRTQRKKFTGNTNYFLGVSNFFCSRTILII